MLYTYFTEELLGLQGVKVANIEKEENNIIIYLEMERKSHSCPCCGTDTKTIHDYILQKVKDIPSFGKNIVIKLRKRRYRCPNCGKSYPKAELPQVLSIKEKFLEILDCNDRETAKEKMSDWIANASNNSMLNIYHLYSL